MLIKRAKVGSNSTPLTTLERQKSPSKALASDPPPVVEGEAGAELSAGSPGPATSVDGVAPGPALPLGLLPLLRLGSQLVP